MFKRSTLILMATALALVVGFVVFDQLQTKREETIAEQSRLMAFEPEEVSTIEIRRSETAEAEIGEPGSTDDGADPGSNTSEVILIERNTDDGSPWLVTDPVETRGEEVAIETLLTSASGLIPTLDIELPEGSDLGDFGLDPARGILTLTLDDESTRVLELGGPDFDNTGVYARAEDGRIVTVPVSQFDALVPDLFTVRDKVLFTAPRSQMASVTLEQDGETVELEQDESTWMITEPRALPTDPTAVDSFLNPLLSLQVASFEAESKDEVDLDDYGLEDPLTELFIQMRSDEPITLALASPDDGLTTYAITSESTTVSTLAPATAQSLQVTLDDLRSKAIVPSFEISAVSEVDIDAQDPDLTRVLTPRDPEPPAEEGEETPAPFGSGVDWQLSDQPERMIRLDSFFTSLQGFQATEFISESSADAQRLNDPEFTITLEIEDVEDPITIEFAQEGDQGFIRTTYQPDVLVVAASTIDDFETVMGTFKPLDAQADGETTTEEELREDQSSSENEDPSESEDALDSMRSTEDDDSEDEDTDDSVNAENEDDSDNDSVNAEDVEDSDNDSMSAEDAEDPTSSTSGDASNGSDSAAEGSDETTSESEESNNSSESEES